MIWTRAYRWALKLLPEPFRREYGDVMAETYAALASDPVTP